MPVIVSSVIAKDVVVNNGTRWIREDHTDDFGEVFENWYAPQRGVDPTKQIFEHIPIVEAAIADKAIDAARTELLEKVASLPTGKLADAKVFLDDAATSLVISAKVA